MYVNVSQSDYSLLTSHNFFYSDIFRLIIIIYIFFSFIVNILNFIAIIIKQCKKKQISIAIISSCSILLANFIHTSAYLFEWIIKNGKDRNENEIKTETIKDKNGNDFEIGGLLLGNPSNFSACYAQAFILISSSISQDFIINIFFFIVTMSEKQANKKILQISLLFLIFGLIFPIGFTLFYFLLDVLGLNDKFCYVKKFEFTINENKVNYSYFEKFLIWVIVVYGIRVINFIITLILIIRIIIFMIKENQNKIDIFKAILIPLIQLFTILIGVAYRILNIFYPSCKILTDLYLVLNTSDGILFPFIFLLKNNIYNSLKACFSDDLVEINSESGSNQIVDDNISDYNEEEDGD